MSKRIFLTASWQKLILANYTIDPGVLQPYLPAHTELDYWKEKSYVSLVGFMFRDLRLIGIKIPFHSQFPEINLRFYVRYKDRDGWKRGVVFIREFVPLPAVAFIANRVFKENYSAMPMRYSWKETDHWSIAYHWKKKDRWNLLEVEADKPARTIVEGSQEDFITQHFWGYSKLKGMRSAEYEVTHPRWEHYPVNAYKIDCDFEGLYGTKFRELKSAQPDSVFLAEGSPITVHEKRIIDH